MIVIVIEPVIVVVIANVAVAAHVNVTANVIVAVPVDGVDPTHQRTTMLAFQKLDVYQRAVDFLVVANRARKKLPRGNADLADQLRRAAQSISQNIAEGAGRATRPDKGRHYTIARGSAMECAAHLDVMRVEEMVDETDYTLGIELLERVVAMLTRLIDP